MGLVQDRPAKSEEELYHTTFRVAIVLVTLGIIIFVISVTTCMLNNDRTERLKIESQKSCPHVIQRGDQPQTYTFVNEDNTVILTITVTGKNP